MLFDQGNTSGFTCICVVCGIFTEHIIAMFWRNSTINGTFAICKEEIYVGGISATKPCRNLLERRKTLLKPTEWFYSILLVCDKYNTTNWNGLRISMKINQMQTIIHKSPKSIATSRLHCAYRPKCEKVRQLYSLCRIHSHEGCSAQWWQKNETNEYMTDIVSVCWH